MQINDHSPGIELARKLRQTKAFQDAIEEAMRTCVANRVDLRELTRSSTLATPSSPKEAP